MNIRLYDYDYTTIRLYDYTTIRLYDYTTIRLYDYTTIQLYDYITIQLYNCTTVQLYNRTTVQLYNYTTIGLILTPFMANVLFLTYSSRRRSWTAFFLLACTRSDRLVSSWEKRATISSLRLSPMLAHWLPDDNTSFLQHVNNVKVGQSSLYCQDENIQ